MSFPSAIPSYTGFTSTHTLSQDQHASQHNSEQADIVALATKVGTGSATAASNQVLRGNGTGTSAWDQVHAATDISGVLGQANGGTGRTDSTGTGAPVYQASPTITTPTIASFTNAQHNHQSAGGGGTLNAASALQSGSVSYANLLATIFSDQINSYSNSNTAGGTFHYVNLGGFKIVFGTSANQATSSGGNDYNIDMPTSFFSTIYATVANPANLTVQGNQYASIDTAAISSASTITVRMVSPSGAATAAISLIVVGI